MIRATLRVLIIAGGLVTANSAWAQDVVVTAPPEAPAAAPETPIAAPETPTPASETTPLAPQPELLAPDQAPPPAAVPATIQAQPLTQLDFFSTGRDTGLGEDVWKGSSADIARAVIPGLAAKPLSPAAAGLARRLLAQASTAPTGAGNDLDLAVARARALLALGDAEDASLVLDRTPGVADHADLSGLAAEAALISEQDDKACHIADNLTDGRGGLYWLRLRAFCQARAGKADEAQLTFNLAGGEGGDAATARLLGVFIAGMGDPGPPSLRDGLDYAVSRALKLDLTPALAFASPAVGRHWMLTNSNTAGVPDPPVGPLQAASLVAGLAPAPGQPDSAVLEQLIDRGARETSPKARARLQSAAAILASLGGDMSSAARAQLAEFELGRSETPPARLLALNIAAASGLKGETALLALQIDQSGGAAGPAPADRCWIIRALDRVGFKNDAEAFAVEGLMALRPPS